MQIEFESVNYAYTKRDYILEGINLKLNYGITALCGDNGSGKSTLINLMNLILLPKEGSVFIDGNKVKKKKSSYRKNIGVVYQFSDMELFNLTVEEDLLYAVKVQRKDEKKARENIEKYFKLFKLDLDILTTSPFKLSGGQKKKISIISSLILQPQILILDEPLIGLDNESKKELLIILKKLKKEIKILIVLHDYDYIHEIADNIIELKDKRIVNDCLAEEFFEKKYKANNAFQLTSIQKIGKTLNMAYDNVKSFSEEEFILYLKENYELY